MTSLPSPLNTKMNIKRLALCSLFVVAFSIAALAQSVRTTTKTDKFDLSSGATLTVTGAPNGSIKIIGSPKNEIEIIATIGIEAANDADFAKLAAITGFVTDESAIRVAIGSVGPHNKFGLKKLPKDFPKNLLATPFRIDYEIRVPRYTDLEIDGGKGDLSITGVEGSMRVNFIETKGDVEVVGGTTNITVGKGTLDMAFGVRGWRGRSATVNVGSGELNVSLPSNMHAEIEATILKTGTIANSLVDLKPRDRKVAFTDKSILAKAGVGGSPLKFTVGDGTMKLERLTLPL